LAIGKVTKPTANGQKPKAKKTEVEINKKPDIQ
jgi:hypothetical protein